MDGKALRPDGKQAATLIPPAFGLAGANLHTWTGWGSVTHWNAFVANLEMHGKGTFFDPRLKDATRFPVAARAGFDNVRNTPDLVTSKLAALHVYQLAIPAPRPPAGSFDSQAAARGEVLFYVEPGRTVRWIVDANVHTTTAYHPKNDGHSLRIPEAAIPWDSGFLVNRGDHFEVRLTVPGVYDYYCQPHEAAGMVGRIVVRRPVGPGALPFDYFQRRSGTETWKLVPEAAQKTFPSVESIMRERIVERKRGAL